MQYFVTGGTGFIGSRVVDRLLADGHEVTVLTRSRANATHLPETVRVVEGEITDKEAMREAMDGADGVFHIAAWFYVGPGRRERVRAERINVEGTRVVLELVDELAIPKAVYTSTIGVYPPTTAIIDESVRPSCPAASVYVRTKWQAHYEVAQPMMDEGLPLVIVQPGIVYGPGDKPTGSVREGFRAYLRGELPLTPRGTYAPWDYVDDTADAHVRAMDRGEPGETYLITNETAAFTEVFDLVERITGVPAPRPAPAAVFALLGRAFGLAERVVPPREGFEAETLRFLGETRWPVDTSKARRELGTTHRPLEEGLRKYLAWEQAQLVNESAAVVERPAA
jgi:dihydroflavonol-4-reductase